MQNVEALLKAMNALTHEQDLKIATLAKNGLLPNQSPEGCRSETVQLHGSTSEEI